MANDLAEEMDKEKIDVRHSWDVNYWCEEFNLRAEDLKEIIKVTGPSVEAVRAHIARKMFTSAWPLNY